MTISSFFPAFLFLASRFWLRPDILDMWNMPELEEEEFELANKTNNALERYNREFNNIFPSKHPNLLVFAPRLRTEMDNQKQRLENCRKRRQTPPIYQAVSFPAIPKEYSDFDKYAYPLMVGKKADKAKKTTAKKRKRG